MSSRMVTFSRFKWNAFVGVMGGVMLAVGVPYVTLAYGQNLWSGLQAIIIILALILGFALAVVSAFFGLVIPSKVGHGTTPNERIRVHKTSEGGTVEMGSASQQQSSQTPPSQETG